MQDTNTSQTVILPPHKNKMAMSIICTLFCFIIGGIVAMINAAKANELYNNALLSSDSSIKTTLYYQSEAKNKAAQTWITISIIIGIIDVIIAIILFATGVLSEWI